jgi:hypothetical protein
MRFGVTVIVCAAAMAVLACSGASTDEPAGTEGKPGGGLRGSAGEPVGSDLCSRACAKLSACGVLLDQTQCAADCKDKAPTFAACVEKANVDDCNALATCSLKESCGGHVPSGRMSCGAAESCIAQCAYGDASCACGCTTALTASEAIDIVVDTSCATYRCAQACGPGSNAAICADCFVKNCKQQSDRCHQAP